MTSSRVAVPTDLTAGTWVIDPVHSSIGFRVRHLMVGRVRGNFRAFTGAIVVADDGSPSVSAEIEVGSVDTGNGQRDAHVQAPDFFDVARFPVASFISTGVRADGADFLVDGEFTLKGVTKPVTLQLAFDGVNPGVGRGEVAGFEASVTLNRKDFGVDFDMPLDGGGLGIGEQVTITLEIEALKQA